MLIPFPYNIGILCTTLNTRLACFKQYALTIRDLWQLQLILLIVIMQNALIFKQSNMNKITLIFVLLFTPLLATATTLPPPADEVFQLSANVQDPNNIILEWQTKSGFFLYRDRIKLTPKEDNNFKLGNARFPEAIKYHDKQGSTFQIYRNKLILPIAILGEEPGEGFLNIKYQGCADDGFCYPPQTNQIKISINNELEVSAVNIEPSPVTSPISDVMTEGGEQMRQLFNEKNWGLIYLSFLGFGILLTFTPCVLPMIPVLSGIIVGQGRDISTRKAFFLSLSYVLSMASTYAIFGAVVAMAGKNLQIIMQSPWAIGSFSFIFVMLSLSMFGFYELRLPSGVHSKLTSYSHRQATGQYLGAAIMGCLSTLILSPCVTAPLVGALSYIASSNDVTNGALALFFLGLGMGIPLLIIGTSAGKLLPKAGAWMNSIKALFGVMLLMVAIYLLSRIVPAALTMAMWACLLILCGIFTGAFNKAATNIDKMRKGAGVMMFVYGILVLIGTSQGNINPMQPLAREAQYLRVDTGLPTKKLTTLSEVQQTIEYSKGTPIILDFYADWCSACQYIDATTLKNQQVLASLKNFVFIKVDVTKNNSESKALLGYFNVIAPPTFIFYDKEGVALNNLRLVGEISPETLEENMERAIAK